MISNARENSVTSVGVIEEPSEFIEKLASRRIAAYGLYDCCFRDVMIQFRDGVLTLTGRVPTFYLKQVLQTLLKNLDGVSRIDNRVEVVNSHGLSSVRAK